MFDSVVAPIASLVLTRPLACLLALLRKRHATRLLFSQSRHRRRSPDPSVYRFVSLQSLVQWPVIGPLFLRKERLLRTHADLLHWRRFALPAAPHGENKDLAVQRLCREF